MDTHGYKVTDRGLVATHAQAGQHGVFVVLARHLRHVALGVRALQVSGKWSLQNEALVRPLLW